jgi:hypothetical protein
MRPASYKRWSVESRDLYGMVKRRPGESPLTSRAVLLVVVHSKQRLLVKALLWAKALTSVFPQDVPARLSGFSAGVQYIASSSPGTRILLKPSRKFSRPVNGWENATGHEARGSWCTTVVNLGTKIACIFRSVWVFLQVMLAVQLVNILTVRSSRDVKIDM